MMQAWNMGEIVMTKSQVEKTEKIVIFATHGPEDPERAALPFVIGNATLAMDAECVVVLQGELLSKGV